MSNLVAFIVWVQKKNEKKINKIKWKNDNKIEYCSIAMSLACSRWKQIVVFLNRRTVCWEA